MKESTEDKQNYLRENIIEKNYDTNQFVQFLQSKRGEAGTDVANWSMEDLKKVVQEFINQMNNQNNQPTQQTNPPSNIPPTVINPTINNQNNTTGTQPKAPEKPVKGTTESLHDAEYGVVYPDLYIATKTDFTKLSNCDVLDIKVTSPEKVDGGFFSKSYMTFQISTSPLNLNIKRRYNDFIWLSQICSKIFHTSIIPKVPKKENKMFDKVKGEFYKVKRMNHLEKFLNFLAKDPLIKNSELFYDFISMDKDDEFARKKKFYERIKAPIYLKDMKSLDGNINVQVTEEKENYFLNIKDNLGYNENFTKMLKDNFKALNDEINVVVDRLRRISIIYKKLFKISEKYFDDSTIIESHRQMHKMFHNWSLTLKNQNNFVNTEIREYFKFVGYNFKYLRGLTQLVDSHKSSFFKGAKSLISKKKELFRKKDTTKWDLTIEDKNNVNTFINDQATAYAKICYKDTANVIYLKQEYGYYLNRIISEYERLRHINGIVNKEKTISYSKKQSDFVSDFYKILGEIITTMDSCVNIASNKWLSQGVRVQPLPEEGIGSLAESQNSINYQNINEGQNNP